MKNEYVKHPYRQTDRQTWFYKDTWFVLLLSVQVNFSVAPREDDWETVSDPIANKTTK
jgi:hypothetical protein